MLGEVCRRGGPPANNVLWDVNTFPRLDGVWRRISTREGTTGMSVYKVIELVGTSETSWEDAAKQAIERAGQKLADLRVGEITSQDVKIEDGKVTGYRSRVKVSFKFRED